MKKKNMAFTAIGAAATAVAGLLIKEKNREQVMEKANELKQKMMKKEEEEFLPIDKAGKPDPNDTEDNKMVSEGAVYGVNYYNEQKQQA